MSSAPATKEELDFALKVRRALDAVSYTHL